MPNKTPRHINPLVVRIPLTALVSIMHRVSGILVFLLLPFFLSVLAKSLASPEAFAQVKASAEAPVCQGIVWIFFSALLFHLLAGIRHLLMDVHIGGGLRAARLSAGFILVATLVTILIFIFLFSSSWVRS